METLKRSKVPIFLILNKIDLISRETLIMLINEYQNYLSFAEIIPISALKKDNTDHLIYVIKKYLTDTVRYFDIDMITSNSKSFMVSELVREKLLWVCEDEVPHSLTCLTTKFEEKDNVAVICVDIIVDRDSIKKIIIGRKGERLKLVGTRAREEIEQLINKKVYLELYVKTIKNWKEKEASLKDLGFDELNLK